MKRHIINACHLERSFPENVLGWSLVPENIHWTRFSKTLLRYSSPRQPRSRAFCKGRCDLSTWRNRPEILFPQRDIHQVGIENENIHARGEDMNPKVGIIIDEFFPKIVEHHIRTRSSVEATMKSLDRYRAMGLQVIRGLSAEAREEDSLALEQAYQAAVKRLQEFHSQEASPGSFVAKAQSNGSDREG